MGDEEAEKRKQWSQRISWAKCIEPYKTELDTIGSHWIEGQLSNGELALELWEQWSSTKFSEMPSSTLPGTPLPDVQAQIEILAEALLAAELYPKTTPEERRELLDNQLARFGKDSNLHR